VLPALLLLPTFVSLASTPAQAQRHPAASAALVKVAPAHVLVAPKGLTLYVFAPDKPNKSTCYGKCATFWPPVVVPSGTTPPAHLPGIPGTFGVAMRTDGTRQLTYDRAPLYTFLEDKSAGAMNGQGLDYLGYWWVVVADGH
jgi:predicted lipoprotein with Yx(FWY)xxD motif